MMAAPIFESAMSLADLLAGVAGVPPGTPDLPVAGLAMDTRDLVPGSVFLAVAGTRRHGLDFLRAATAAGACVVLAEPTHEWTSERMAAVASDVGVPLVPVPQLGCLAGSLASRFHGEPSRRLHVTGITGTNGKTSCAHFLAQASDAGHCALVGTLGNGFPGALTRSSHTTPDPTRLQALLADFVAQGADAVAMEVSSHALHQHRVAGVAFDVAVFTNLSRDHLDYHDTMEAYADAKAQLFATPGLEAAVINAGDAVGQRLLATLASGVRSLAYGLDLDTSPGAGAWLTARRVETTPEGLSLEIGGSWGEGRLSTGVLGRFNAANLLAVLGVLLVRGLSFTTALARLGAVKGVPGRMELMRVPGRPAAVVDYAHTPDALEQVLAAVRAHCAGRLTCVFGCGGERDRGKRPLMGALAERLADRVILSDDNPRSEDGAAIIGDILAGLRTPAAAIVERDRAGAIARAIGEARTDDWVLVAGKGHEDYQLVGDLRLPFSDIAVVRACLQGGDL